MKPGWRPERRNCKIGTSSAGFKHRNRLAIPRYYGASDDGGDARYFHSRINPDITEVRCVPGSPLFPIAFLYENPRPGCAYGCGIDDVFHLLSHLPDEDRYMMDMNVFRQPTRKQANLSSVWGRAIYCTEIAGHVGAAIILEAYELGKPIRWSRSQDPEDAAEFERLSRDYGHEIVADKRGYTITPNEQSVRNTLLYRTLLHEVGHLVHYTRDVLSKPDDLIDEAWDAYFAQASSEHEVFAHRYAKEMAAKLRSEGIIPFEPLG